MLVFSAGLVCYVFREELALMLHHASVWGELSGAAVEVTGLAERGRPGGETEYWDLAVRLTAAGADRNLTAALCAYLARVLPTTYAVRDQRDAIEVAWRGSTLARSAAEPLRAPAPVVGE